MRVLGSVQVCRRWSTVMRAKSPLIRIAGCRNLFLAKFRRLEAAHWTTFSLATGSNQMGRVVHLNPVSSVVRFYPCAPRELGWLLLLLKRSANYRGELFSDPQLRSFGWFLSGSRSRGCSVTFIKTGHARMALEEDFI